LIESDLQRIFGARLVYEQTKQDWSIFCFIDDIKVDILRYLHPIISEVRISFLILHLFHPFRVIGVKKEFVH